MGRVVLLEEFYAVFQLSCHLIDLGRLHVHVVDPESLDYYWLSSLVNLNTGVYFLSNFIIKLLLQVFVKLMPLLKFRYHEFLQLRHVDDVIHSHDLAEDGQTDLVCDGAVAETAHHYEERLDQVSSERLTQEPS